MIIIITIIIARDVILTVKHVSIMLLFKSSITIISRGAEENAKHQ